MQISSVSLRGRDMQPYRKMKPTTGQRRTYRQQLALGWGGGGVRPAVALSLPLGRAGAGGRGAGSSLVQRDRGRGGGAVVIPSRGGAGARHSKSAKSPGGGIKTPTPPREKSRFPNRGVARQTAWNPNTPSICPLYCGASRQVRADLVKWSTSETSGVFLFYIHITPTSLPNG